MIPLRGWFSAEQLHLKEHIPVFSGMSKTRKMSAKVWNTIVGKKNILKDVCFSCKYFLQTKTVLTIPIFYWYIFCFLYVFHIKWECIKCKAHVQHPHQHQCDTAFCVTMRDIRIKHLLVSFMQGFWRGGDLLNYGNLVSSFSGVPYCFIIVKVTVLFM